MMNDCFNTNLSDMWIRGRRRNKQNNANNKGIIKFHQICFVKFDVPPCREKVFHAINVFRSPEQLGIQMKFTAVSIVFEI